MGVGHALSDSSFGDGGFNFIKDFCNMFGFVNN